MTVSVCPSDERPAVRAKGTVRPSAKPRVKSVRKRVRVVLDFVVGGCGSDGDGGGLGRVVVEEDGVGGSLSLSGRVV